MSDFKIGDIVKFQHEGETHLGKVVLVSDTHLSLDHVEHLPEAVDDIAIAGATLVHRDEK